MQLDYDALKDQVITTLTLAERMGLANRNVVIDDPDVIEMYAAVLARNGISGPMLHEAGPSIFGEEEFFPRPAALVKHCLPIKERMLQEAKAAFYASVVEAVDPSGVTVLALPQRVRNGVLLPEGDMSGDGSAAPSLPAREVKRDDPRVQALLTGQALPLTPKVPTSLPEKVEATPEEEAAVAEARARFVKSASVIPLNREEK